MTGCVCISVRVVPQLVLLMVLLLPVSQEVRPALLSVCAANHARAGTGGDGQDSCPGPEFSCQLLQV